MRPKRVRCAGKRKKTARSRGLDQPEQHHSDCRRANAGKSHCRFGQFSGLLHRPLHIPGKRGTDQTLERQNKSNGEDDIGNRCLRRCMSYCAFVPFDVRERPIGSFR